MSRKYPRNITVARLAEPQRMNDKVRTSDQFLESIVQNANVWINVLDAEENVLIWNRAAEVMSGYSVEEVMGHGKVWEWLYPDQDYRKQITDQVNNLMKRGKAEIDVETKITRKDGKVRIISWNERSLLSQNGKVIGSIAIGRDITKRKQLEQQLQESEKKYRAMVENSPNLIGIFQDGVLKYANSVAIHNLGWTLEELTSPSFDPIENVVSKKSRSVLKENVGKRLRGENVGPYEISLTRRDGSEVPVVVRGSQIVYDGRPAIQFSFSDLTERRLAEEKERDAASYARSLIEASLDPLVTISEKGQITDVNKATEVVTEFSREQLIGTDFSSYFTDPKKAKEAYIEVFAKGILKDYPLVLLSKSGKETHVLYNASVYKDEVGKVRGVFAAARDITQLKHAEEELRKSEETIRVSEKRLREAMDATNDGLWEWNVETGEMYYSPAWYQIIGYEPGELQGHIQTWRELVHPDDRDRAIRVNEDCINNRIQKFEVEYRMRAKGGQWKWILGRGSATTRNADGRALRMVGTHADITERKQMELLMVETKNRLSLALKTSRQGFWDWDLVHDTTYLDPGYYEIIGYTEGEFQPNYGWFTQSMHPDDLSRVKETMSGNLEGRTDYSEIEYRVLTKSGEYKWISGVGQVVERDPQGKPLRMIGVIRDISERHRMEERLRSLHEHALGLSSATNLEEIVNRTLDTIQFTLGFDCVDFNLIENGMAVVKGTRGWDKGSFTVSLQEPSIVAEAARTMKSVRVDDTRKEPDYLDRMGRAWKGLPTMLSELATPVIIDDKVVAVLNIENVQANAFWEQDQELLETLASHVASTLKRGRLERELKKYSENLEATVEERTKELRLTKERLEYVIESNPAVIYTAKPLPDFSDYYPTYQSRNVLSMVGFEAEKFIGAEGAAFWTSRVHPDDLARCTAERPTLWKVGHHTVEYRFLHKNGTYRWIREEGRVIRDSTGSVLDVIGFWTDVTERKLAQESEEAHHAEVTLQLSDITDRLESLAKTREKLKTVPDIVTGLDVVLETVLWDFDLDFGAVLVLDRQANRMNVRASKGKTKEISLNQSYPLEGLVELKGLQAKSITKIIGKGERSIFGTAVVHTIPILAGTEIYGVLAFGAEELNSLQESKVRILELYAELVHSFVIEKSVAVTPVLESKTTQGISDLESGQMYLFKKDPAEAFDVFASTVFGGHEGLCITRMYPPKVRIKYGLEKTPIVWLTSEAYEGEKSVHSIQDLSIMVGDYLEKAEKAVVMIDGFEYLITNHGFESFLKFLQILKNRLQVRNGVLIAPVFEQALAPKELALIEREMQALTEQ